MSSKNVTVVYLKDRESAPVAMVLQDSYEGLKKLIDGWIDCRQIDGDYDLWLNDEGLLRDDMTPTLRFPDGTVICGPVVVARHNQEGETTSVPAFTIETVKKWLEQYRAPEGTEKPEADIQIISWG